MKLIRENSRLIFLPERDSTYSIELPDGTLLQGEGKQTLPESNQIHPVYQVSFDSETFYLAEQLVSEVHITNFRDIGGYRGADGRQVRYGCFYRSAPITFSSEADRQAFRQLHMKYILDLRSDMEAQKVPDETIEGCEYLHYSAIALDNAYQGNFDMEDLIRNGALAKLNGYMIEIYRELPFRNEAYQNMFHLMLHGETPFVFHCSAGKDRTGFAAYLILKALGVSEECILQDYLQSNIYRDAENQAFLRQMPQLAGMDGLIYVKEEYLKASLQAIAERYGDFSTYVKAEYGMGPEEIAAIRERYLY